MRLLDKDGSVLVSSGEIRDIKVLKSFNDSAIVQVDMLLMVMVPF
jgi:hypothetical protein